MINNDLAGYGSGTKVAAKATSATSASYTRALKSTIYSNSKSSISIPSSTVTTLTQVGVDKGRYLVFGSACITSHSYDTKFGMKISISMYTNFDNTNCGGVTSEPAFGTSMNCWAILDITGDVTLSLLGYHSADYNDATTGTTRTATNIKLQAIKLY